MTKTKLRQLLRLLTILQHKYQNTSSFSQKIHEDVFINSHDDLHIQVSALLDSYSNHLMLEEMMWNLIDAYSECNMELYRQLFFGKKSQTKQK